MTATAPDATREATAPVSAGPLTARHATLAACCAIAAWVLLLSAVLATADLDMFHEMALARAALIQGRLPLGDLFAYTPTVFPVVHHEWGTGFVLYGLAVGAGLGAAGVMLLKYALLATLFWACARCATLRGAPAPVAAVLAPVGLFLVTVGFATVRAQLFSLVLLAALLLLLEADRRGRRWWIAAWLPLYVVWLNLHGGFVVGAGVLALYTLERFARAWAGGGFRAAVRDTWHLFAVGLAMLPLTLVNPYGWAYVPYIWKAVALDRPTITEWRPVWDPVHGPGLLAGFALSLVPVVYAAIVRGPRRLPGLVLLLVTAWLGARHARHLSLYAVVWFCLVPAWLAGTGFAGRVGRLWERRPALVTGVWAVLGIAALFHAVELRFWAMRVPNRSAVVGMGYPVGAVDYLQAQGFRGNLMTPFEVGAYVSWKLWPRVKVSLDSRYEVAYPAGAVEEGDVFYEALPGWIAVLTKYPTDAVLVPSGAAVDTALARDARWRRVYQDDAYSVFASPRWWGTLRRSETDITPAEGAFP